MKTLDIICLIAWFVLGLYDLFKRKDITKLDYGLVWFVLILLLIEKAVR